MAKSHAVGVEEAAPVALHDLWFLSLEIYFSDCFRVFLFLITYRAGYRYMVPRDKMLLSYASASLF